QSTGARTAKIVAVRGLQNAPDGRPGVALLEVTDLRTHLESRRGVNRAVNGVSFKLDTGKSLGIVGESGSGKSMTALSILRLVPQPYARVVGGSIRFDGGGPLQEARPGRRRRCRGSSSV